MVTALGIMDGQSRKIAEALKPKFTALQTEIDSVKTSLDQVKDDVSKMKETINTITETQKTSHIATTKGLKELAEKAKSLEAFLGEPQMGYDRDEHRTIMGRLEEICQFLGDVFEKLADREADGALFLFPTIEFFHESFL